MRVRVAMLVAGAVLLGGCSSGVEGSPVDAERWDPCSISPDAIAAAGLDPEYRNEGWGTGLVVEEWAKCSFKPPGTEVPYFLSVVSSVDHTIDEARRNSLNIDGRDIEVADRDGFQYRTRVGNTGRSCDIAVDLPPGVVVFAVLDMEELADNELCRLVLEHTNDLAASLPK